MYSIDAYVRYEILAGGQGLLTVDAFPWELYEDETSPIVDLFAGDFHVEVLVDQLTGVAVSGSLSVTGDPYPPFDVVSLFNSNTLTGFGFGGSDLFDFTFTQQGDTVLAPDGSTVGIIVSAVSMPDNLFGVVHPDGTVFENNSNGFTDVFFYPEPTSIAMLSLAGLTLLRKRRTKRPARV